MRSNATCASLRWAKLVFPVTPISRWRLIMLAPLCIVAGQIFIAEISGYLGFSSEVSWNPLESSSAVVKLFWTVFAAPLVETILFQWIGIELLRKLRFGWCLSALISAVLFAAAHGFAERWPIEIFIAGIVFAYVFVVEARRQDGHPVLVTVAVHALFNLMVFAISAWS